MLSHFALSIGLLQILIGAARCDEAAKWMITAECQMIVLPQKNALPLLADFRDETKAEATMAKLTQMIARGEATLAANLVGKARENDDLTSENMEEFRYPTHFMEPNLPYPLPKEKALETLKAWPAVVLAPADFGTHRVGTLFQAHVSVSDDGKWLRSRLVAQHSRLVRMENFEVGTLASGAKLTIAQPLFHTAKTTTSLTVRNGQSVLLGAHHPPQPEGAIELFLLRLTATKGGPE